jgi:hypothetical protein
MVFFFFFFCKKKEKKEKKKGHAWVYNKTSQSNLAQEKAKVLLIPWIYC